MDGSPNAGHPTPATEVLLWPDTFNDHFTPEVARAAVEVLEAAGFQVMVPEEDLCCGRPLYDYGMLDTAERWLLQILTALSPAIERGVPVVGLEPSCVAVFRDELTNLFPNNHDAVRLKLQSFTLAEFLEKEGFQPPRLARKALVHGHCQQKAIMKLTAEEAILKKLGLDYEIPDDGCCGMAGAFGYEAGDHYDVSIRCGERVLLPAVRAASKDTLIIADGYSCREQIAQCTDRRALHLAQVIRMAIQGDTAGTNGEYPERSLSRNGHQRSENGAPALKTAALIAGGALAAGGLAYLAMRKAKKG